MDCATLLLGQPVFKASPGQSMSAYVTGYQFDVFISYSHANKAEGWVTKFRKTLEDRLKERVPSPPVFFQDTAEVQGNEELTPEIVTGIRNCAVLVPIV